METLHATGRAVRVVSDLHVGRPAPLGFPAALEDLLVREIRAARDAGALLVLDGDVLDLPPRRWPTDVLSLHRRLVAELADAALDTGVVYVVGNHDPPPAELGGLLPWEVALGVRVGATWIVHGDRFDRAPLGRRGQALHARLEECVGARLDLPVERHPSLANRALVAGVGAVASAARRVRPTVDPVLDYLASMEGPDPRGVLREIGRAALPDGVRRLVIGHTHRPGVARVGAVEVVNCGTWDATWATVVHLDGDDARVVDARTGRQVGAEAYAGWDDDRGGFAEWWDGPGRRHRPAALLRTWRGGTEMGELAFSEHLGGTWQDRRVDVRLSGRLGAGAVVDDVDVEGQIDVDGLAAGRPVAGRIGLDGQGLRYALSFVGDDGWPYRLVGRKTRDWRDPVASLTRLDAELFDARARSLGPVVLTFSLAEDLGPFLRSLRPVRSEPGRRDAGHHGFDADPLPGEGLGGRVVVTGAAGHLGQALVRRLLARGYAVRAIVRSARDPRAAVLAGLGAEVVEADVLQPATLRPAFDGARGVFHAAATFRYDAADPEAEIVRPIVDGARNAVRAAIEAGAARFVLTSSAITAGSDASGGEPLDERRWNDAPSSAYTRGKVEAERIAAELAGRAGLPYVAVLPGAVLGPFCYRDTPTTEPVARLLRPGPRVLPDCRTTVVDVRDAAAAHVLVYEYPDAAGRYLAGAWFVAWSRLARLAEEADPSLAPIRVVPEAATPLVAAAGWLADRLAGRPARWIPREALAELVGLEPRYDSGRLRALGWTPLPLERTVADTIAWLRTRP